jgi:hypothetical protein
MYRTELSYKFRLDTMRSFGGFFQEPPRTTRAGHGELSQAEPLAGGPA